MPKNAIQVDGGQNADTLIDFFELQRDLITLIDDYRNTHKINNKKMTLKAFAEFADISVPILTAITNGNRWIANASRDTVVKLAKALEIPVLQVYILGGFIKNSDVIYTGQISNSLELVYRQMARDPMMEFKFPKRVKNEPTEIAGNVANAIRVIYAQMKRDPNMAFKLPTKDLWDKWPQSAKLAFIMLYEDLANKILLRYATLPKRD